MTLPKSHLQTVLTAVSTTLDKLHEGLEDNITVKCKVLKVGPTATSDIKRANKTFTEQQMKEITKLKFQELHKFKRKANEDHRSLILTLAAHGNEFI